VSVGVEKSKRIREQKLTDEEATRLRADSACDERILASMRAELAGLRVKCEAPRKLERLLMLGTGKKLRGRPSSRR
jgi:hypothetical protein